MEAFETKSVRGTLALGRKFALRLAVGDCVALIGPLGAGKTALVRGIVQGLGLEDKRMVSSPTFVIVQEYPASLPVHHIDLYRMGSPAAELRDLGIEEMLQRGVVLIEWADRATEALPRPRWEIRIEPTGASSRQFRVGRIC